MRYFIFLVFLFSFQLLSAQKIDTSQIRMQYEQALVLSKQEDYKEAYELAQKAYNQLIALDATYLDLEIGFNHVLGDCNLELGNYSKALAYYQKSQIILQDHQVTDGLLMAETLHKIGFYYQEIKDFERAVQHFEPALEIRRDILGNRHLKIADIYNNLGVCKNSTGDFDKALEFHDQALAICLDQLPDFHPRIAQIYNNLGVCMENRGEFQLALRNYERAMDQYRQLYGEHHLDLADVYLNVGPVYDALDEPQRNIAYLMLALKIYQKQLDENHPSIGICYNNLANAYNYQEDYIKATQMYEKALANRKSNYGEAHPDVAQTYFNMGICHSWQGHNEEAIAVFSQCFRALNYQPDPNPDFEEVNDHHTLMLLFLYLSEAQIERYQSSKVREDLLQAFSYYQQADQLIDFLRTRYEAIGSKLGLADLAHQLYDSAIVLAMDLFNLTKDKTYQEQAFLFSEKSKGLLLLEALKKTDAELFAGVPKALTSEMDTLEMQIAQLEKDRFLAWENESLGNDKLIDSLGSLIFEKRQKVSNLIQTIKKKYPHYYNLRYETSTIPVELIQKELLEPGQTMIEYFLGANYLHIFVINQNDFDVLRVAIEEDFLVWISAFHGAIRRFPNVSNQDLQENIQLYLRAAHFLFRELIGPVEGLLEDQLIIIPDGELGLLPFGALLSQSPDNASTFREHPYLLKDYTISYNYSATLLQEMTARKSTRGLQSYLGFAPAFEKGNTKGLSRLRYNQEEIQEVQKMIGGRYFTGSEATKENFLAHQGDYKVIHLATHGKVNNSSSDFSFLAFSETSDSKGEEALLYVKEIYNMSVNVEMVVLSACETGIGKLQQGEGIASIARGFSYAGAKSLVATQWSVDDKATNELIHLFFAKIKQGKPTGQALREAKLEFIQSKGHGAAHPYFWASFMHIGSMERIAFGPAIPKVAGLLPLAVLLYLGYAWHRRRKIRRA